MNTLVKIVLDIIVGFFVGISILLLSLIFTSAVAFFTNKNASIPWVFEAWFEEENDMPALLFNPHFPGMIVFIIIITVVYVVYAQMAARKKI